MRISDWSSDVCSSDLCKLAGVAGKHPVEPEGGGGGQPVARGGAGGKFRRQPHHPGHFECRAGGGERQGSARDGASQRLCRGFQPAGRHGPCGRSEEHTSELQSLMRISYAVFCLKKKNNTIKIRTKAEN